MKSFRADLRDVLERYSKRTSAPHKRSIFLLLLGGALLRAWMLALPITFEEAKAYDLFIGRSVSTIISEHTDPLDHVFHGLLAHWSIDLFGHGLLPLRLPAFLAGVLAMPLFYLFVRAMFNRYIGMLALALVASSPPLIEYSAIAQGHSITWSCMVLALVLGRHFVQENNLVSALLIGVVLAFGMWSMPETIYAALAIYFWLLFYILMKYQDSVRKRLNLLFLSLLVFMVLTILLYLPVISKYGIWHLFEHSALPDRNWKAFKREHADGAFALWAAIADTTGNFLAFLGIAAVLISAFISTKYRLLMFALALGAIPMVMVQARVAEPPIWYYSLFFFHIGSAIALFYLLKFVQEKFFKGLGKRTRTAFTSLAVFVGMAAMGLKVVIERQPRFEEAEWVANYLAGAMGPEDRAYVEHPWDAPVRFHARAAGLPREQFLGTPTAGNWVFLVVAPAEGQAVHDVLDLHRLTAAQLDELRLVKDGARLEVFAARAKDRSEVSPAY